MKLNNNYKNIALSALMLLVSFTMAFASSHREAPLISNDPLADNVDLYAFRSPDNPDMISIIATYVPLQLPHGGPNYYAFGENVRYEIHVDNDAAVPGDEIIYRFTFNVVNEDPTTFFYIRLGLQNQKLTYTLERSMDGGNSFEAIITDGYVPPNNIGPRSIESAAGLNTTYDALFAQGITASTTGETVFAGPTDDPFFVDLAGIFDLGDAPRQNGDPVDNIACYNVSAIAMNIPIATLRKAGAAATPANILDSDYVIGVWASASRPAVTTISSDGDPSYEGDWVQVSRLGMPLTNEAVIAIGDKDYWNAITPYEEIGETTLDGYFYNPELALYMDDDQFGDAVPAFAPLRIQTASLGAFDFSNGADGLFGLKGSDAVEGTALDDDVFGTLLLPGAGQPRSVDLWPIFHTGVPNVRPYQLATGKMGDPLAAGKPFINNFLPNGGDMLRLNMATPTTDRGSDSFSSLGLINAAVLGLTDPAYANTDIEFIPNMDGFPNGRRLEDDVTRIELQAVGGVVLAAIGLWYDDYDPETSASPVTEDLLGVLGYTTGVEENDRPFTGSFPYLAQPFSGTGDCSGEIQNNPNPPVEVIDPDFKVYVSSNNQAQIAVLELKDGDTEVNITEVINEDADGIHYDDENDVVYQLDRTNNVVRAYSNFYANLIAGLPVEMTATSTSDFINGREISVSDDKLVVAQDANDANGQTNTFVIYDISATSITLDRILTSPINLWGIDFDGSTLYAIEDNSANLAVFEDFFDNNAMAVVTRSISIEDMVRTHGLTYEASSDMMILTDVAEGSVADDGAFTVVPGFLAAAADNNISADEQNRVEGSNTFLGNPVDVGYDKDADLIYIAERANDGGRILGFEVPTMDGNFEPVYNLSYGGASAIFFSDCLNGNDDGGNEEEEGTVVYFDLDDCTSFLEDGSGFDFSEFDADYPEELDCAEFSSGGLFRNNPEVNGHSCTPGIDGSEAMCVSADESCDFVADADKAIRFSITVSPDDDNEASLTGLSFYEKGPEMFNWIDGDSGPNNYPTKYGVRVSVDGNEIFNLNEIETTLDWTLETFDFNDIDGFTVSEETTFDFELLGYCLVGNGAAMAAWDIDEVNVTASCDETDDLTFDINGEIKTEEGVALSEIEVIANGIGVVEYPRSTFTNDEGQYAFGSNPANFTYEISSNSSNDYLNGITTLDIIFLQKHILGLEVLQSPYKRIAADVNGDQSIDGVDIIQIRKLLLGFYPGDEFPSNSSWKFIDEDQTLDLDFPWNFTEVNTIENLDQNTVENFVAVKVGDINATATSNFNGKNAQVRTDKALTFAMNEMKLEANGTYTIDVTSDNFNKIAGFQFTLNTFGVEVVNVQPGAIALSNGNIAVLNRDLTTFSWNAVETVSINSKDVLFSITLKATKATKVSDAIVMNSAFTNAEAYTGNDLEIITTDIDFREDNGESVATGFALYQNTPNPFNNTTSIQFTLPATGQATLSIYDIDGKLVQKYTNEYAKGMNTQIIRNGDLSSNAGVYYYILESNTNRAVKKMVLVK